MTDEVHRCLGGCGKAITRRFALCADCEISYGSSALSWPGWLRFLWQDTMRERRRSYRQKQYEVHFTEQPEYMEVWDGEG
jgi:hypothetical protein